MARKAGYTPKRISRLSASRSRVSWLHRRLSLNRTHASRSQTRVVHRAKTIHAVVPPIEPRRTPLGLSLSCLICSPRLGRGRGYLPTIKIENEPWTIGPRAGRPAGPGGALGGGGPNSAAIVIR